jgi:hypothetical protein
VANPNAGGNIATAAVTVGTSAGQVVGARMGRRAIIVQNLDTAAVFLGGSSVTTSGATAGLSLAANASITLDTFTGALFAISAAGTAANAVHVVEIYG